MEESLPAPHIFGVKMQHKKLRESDDDKYALRRYRFTLWPVTGIQNLALYVLTLILVFIFAPLPSFLSRRYDIGFLGLAFYVSVSFVYRRGISSTRRGKEWTGEVTVGDGLDFRVRFEDYARVLHLDIESIDWVDDQKNRFCINKSYYFWSDKPPEIQQLYEKLTEKQHERASRGGAVDD